jgi:small subunit ribosomal protein S8
VTDSISNMLSMIKNGYMSKQKSIAMPHTKLIEKIADVLVKNGFLENVQTTNEKNKKTLVLTLKYEAKKPALENLERISKPGLRVYVQKENMPRVLGGIGKVIISTSKGIMTGGEAKKQNLGGEIICKIW